MGFSLVWDISKWVWVGKSPKSPLNSLIWDLTVVLAMVGQSTASWGLRSPLQIQFFCLFLNYILQQLYFAHHLLLFFVWEHLEWNPFLHVPTPLLCLNGFMDPANYPLICSQSGLEWNITFGGPTSCLPGSPLLSFWSPVIFTGSPRVSEVKQFRKPEERALARGVYKRSSPKAD